MYIISSLNEMSNYGQNTTGINGVYIWIGPKPPQHGYRIKVSNSSSF